LQWQLSYASSDFIWLEVSGKTQCIASFNGSIRLWSFASTAAPFIPLKGCCWSTPIPAEGEMFDAHLDAALKLLGGRKFVVADWQLTIPPTLVSAFLLLWPVKRPKREHSVATIPR